MKIFKIFLLIFIFYGISFLNSCNNNPADDNGNQPPCDNAQIGQWKSLGLENESITSIAIDPVDERIIYAGSSSNFSAGTSGKLFKSTDCGKTWNMLLSGGNGKFNAIIIDPANPNVVYTIPGSVIKSSNGGLTWSDITGDIHIDYDTQVRSLAIDQKNPNVLYAGTGRPFGGGLYKSTNAGNNWFWIGDSLKDGVASIAIDPNNTNVIFAGTAGRGILWKSTDGGIRWKKTGIGMTGNIIDMVTVDPIQNNLIYAGIRFEGLMKSIDGGNTWWKENLPDSVLNTSDIKFNPNDNFDIYAATAYGLFNQKCATCPWQEINTGIHDNLSINVLALSKDYTLYAGRSSSDKIKGGILVLKIQK